MPAPPKAKNRITRRTNDTTLCDLYFAVAGLAALTGYLHYQRTYELPWMYPAIFMGAAAVAIFHYIRDIVRMVREIKKQDEDNR